MIRNLSVAVAGLSLALMAVAPAVPTVLPLLTDDFENYPSGLIVQGLPTSATINPPPPGAQGDPAEVTGSVTQGSDTVNPNSGSQMLRFVNTQFAGGGGSGQVNEGINTDVYYLLDVSVYAANIATGSASVVLSAFFNTGASSMNEDPSDENFGKVDNAFFLDVRAWSNSDLTTFPMDVKQKNPISPNYLGGVNNFNTPLLTDRDETTWEELSIEFTLPEETNFISVRLGASENLFANSTGADLVSSFADDVSVEITLPEPAMEPGTVPESGSSILLFSVALLGLTATGGCARRRKRLR